ncbi:hypothetical protein BDZ88DRAFT_400732 [Geranomyces variabilis]|nr:hypothetical protein BDZ88DRAFT_400732 [Geranomyces variabilis]
MFSLTALALLASPALSQIFTEYLEFNPPALSISDLQGSASFAARLKTPPSDTATIFWDMPGLSSSSCKTIFTKDNYNVFQTITVSPLPQYTANNTIKFDITAKASAANTTYDSNQEIYPVTRAMTPAQTCISVGDPHFKTFGGFTYDYHTVGVHYLVKHSLLTVQTMQFVCNTATNAFCNSGVAIRYGSSVIVISTDPNNKASTAMTVRQASAGLDGLVVTGSQANSHFLISIGSDGSQIELQANPFNGFNYVDVTVRLASTYAGQVGGLCNTYKAGADTGTGLTCADGSITTSAVVFGDSWIAPTDDNIFNCGDKCNVKTTDAPIPVKGAICAIPNPFPNANAPPPAPDAPATTTLQVTVGGPAPDATTTAVVEAPATVTSTVEVVATTTGADGQVSTATVTSTAVQVVTTTAAAPAGGAGATDPPAPERPSTCSIEFYNEVNKMCISIFVAPGCGEIVQLSFFINTCIKDALLSGSYVFAEAAKQNMMANCRAKSQAATQITSDPVLVKQGQDIAAAAGVGSSPCPGGCGAGGMCTPNGCMCKLGFAGQSCEIDVSKLAVNKASGPLTTQNGATVQQTIAIDAADPNTGVANPAAGNTGATTAPAAGGAYPATAGTTAGNGAGASAPAAGTTAGDNTAAAPATGAAPSTGSTTANTGKTGTSDVVVSSASSIFQTGASVVSVLLAAAALF